MRVIIIILIIILSLDQTGLSQEQECDLRKSKSELIYAVDKDDVICLAMNSEKQKTLLFSFGLWCAPCIEHLPNAIKLAEDHDLDLYVLLIDIEGHGYEVNAIPYLQKRKKDIKVIILKDDYGKTRNKKYKRFLAEITPPDFINENGMSKYIIIDKEGKVIMVTNSDDYKSNDFDNSKMIEERIVPVLKEQ